MGSQSKHELEFWDLDFYANEERREGKDAKEEWGASIQMLGSGEHYGMTDVMWDPSGRYLATSASVWRHAVRCQDLFLAYYRPDMRFTTARKRIRYLGFQRQRSSP